MRRRPFLAALWPTAVGLPAVARTATAPSSPSPSSSSRTHSTASAPNAARPADAASAAPGQAAGGVTHRALRFPEDHGAHPDTHIEWWYVTGWLRDAGRGEADIEPGAGAVRPAASPDFGFQVTFFRLRTGLGEDSPSRFAARQLVFAHAALTDLAAGRDGATAVLMHDQRIAREGFGIVAAPGAGGEQTVRLRDWTLRRAPGAGADGVSTRMHADIRSDRFGLALDLVGTQPVLLQGDGGYSQKGPSPEHASRYYSEPQLRVRGRIERAGRPAQEVVGRAWLDHEWSDRLLPPGAVGWDWLGVNLLDGGALTAFRVRGADGRPVWAGGSWRDARGALRIFAAREVSFEPLRRWRSPHTQAEYPIEWRLVTPAGRLRVVALQDDQELDSRGSTGSVYWEGLSALQREDGTTLGWGYLELTGYAGRLLL